MRPQPVDLPPPTPNPDPQQAALEAIAHTREAALFTRAIADRMAEFLQRHDTPPALEPPVILSASQLIQTSRAKDASKSIGVLNPNGIPVYLGFNGSSARSANRAISVPPVSLMVLPFSALDVELGVDATDVGANTAVVFFWRYDSVQPAFLGKGS